MRAQTSHSHPPRAPGQLQHSLGFKCFLATWFLFLQLSVICVRRHLVFISTVERHLCQETFVHK